VVKYSYEVCGIGSEGKKVRRSEDKKIRRSEDKKVRR
jgi:hypothetical protein